MNSKLSDRLESPSGRPRPWRAAGVSIVGLLVLLMAAVVVGPTRAPAAQIAISVRIGPPVLPVYTQPLCPSPGYIWTPGYWAYDPTDGYYWVPGTWVMAPEPGFLWTPGYWGWNDGLFIWHAGYWGPQVGFYGGINYGFGYTGVGYDGGYWKGREFFYNREVNNINVTNIRNVYSRPVANPGSAERVAYNGGPGGISARPTAAEMAAERQRHIAATKMQQEHQTVASHDRAQFASANHGKPAVLASAKPGQFKATTAKRAAGTATRPSRTPTANRNAERAQSKAPSKASRPERTQAQRKEAAPSRSAERAQGRSPSAESRRSSTPEHTQPRLETAPTRSAERPQARPQESRPARSEPSRAQAPKSNAERRPQAQQREESRPEEKKPPGRGSEPR